jgi:hypothetical protein
MELILLTGEQDQMDQIQRIFENSSDYIEAITGVPPGASDA